MRRLFLATAVASVLSSGVAAESRGAPFLPHPDMVVQAIDQHPVVREADAMLSAARADARARRAGEHEFTLEGEYVYRDTDFDGNFNEWGAGISRGIRLPGKAKADRRIGELGIDVAENGYEDARHRAALTLKDLWMAWLAAEAQATIAETEVETYERQLAAVERQRDLGERADLDVEQVRAAMARAQMESILAQQNRQDARMTLQRSFPDLRLPPEAPALPEPTAPPGDWAEWQRAVVENSHEIDMAQGEADRRLSLARRARLDRFADPTIGLRAFQERGGEETAIGVTLSIPLGGTRRRAVSQSLGAQAVAAEIVAAKVVREIEITADRDILEAQLGLEAWRRSYGALENSEQALARMRRAVELGEQGITELLVAQRQHAEIRRNEAQARARAHSAALQLQIDAHRIWRLGEHEGGEQEP